MSTITLHNESENQLNLIENLLKEMKIKFEISKKEEVAILSDFEKELILKGMDDIKAGRVVSSKKVNKKVKKLFK